MYSPWRGIALFLAGIACPAREQDTLPYTTYTSFDQLLNQSNVQYPSIKRVSDPGTNERPIYTGFFFYQVLQFDATGHYLLGMRVYFENRDVTTTDRADIGYVDLKDGYK